MALVEIEASSCFSRMRPLCTSGSTGPHRQCSTNDVGVMDNSSTAIIPASGLYLMGHEMSEPPPLESPSVHPIFGVHGLVPCSAWGAAPPFQVPCNFGTEWRDLEWGTGIHIGSRVMRIPHSKSHPNWLRFRSECMKIVTFSFKMHQIC